MKLIKLSHFEPADSILSIWDIVHFKPQPGTVWKLVHFPLISCDIVSLTNLTKAVTKQENNKKLLINKK